MNEQFARAHAFWAARSPRERIYLTVGISVVLVGIAYAAIFNPLLKANGKLAATLPQQRAELRLMRIQVSEIERLQSSRTQAAKSSGGLIHAIESSAAAHGVREAVTNLSALPGGDQVRVTTGPMAVSAWLAWFSDLEQEGIPIISYRGTMAGRPGSISVDAMLGGGS